MLESIDSFVTDNATNLVPDNLHSFMVKMNRTIAISPNESRQRTDRIRALDKFLIEKLESDNLVSQLPILAEYCTLCASRKILNNDLV